MKKINIAKITWVTSLFLLLTVILITVMDYKINYQHKTKNVLYFYDYDGTLSVTEVKNDNHLLYSKYECGDELCPSLKKELDNTYVVLTIGNKNMLYNYKEGIIVNDSFDNYKYLNNKYFIVMKNNNQGIIDLDNNLLVPALYEELGYIQNDTLIGYGMNYIVAKKNSKYGIISFKDGTIIEDFIYDETEIDKVLKLLNDKENLS